MICPAEIFANNLIIKANGFVNIPTISIGIMIGIKANGTPGMRRKLVISFGQLYLCNSDTSIGESIIQIGQKDLLLDKQGNWGNVATGDKAAAPRYIETRLTEFALATVYNRNITSWVKSYDGRSDEPEILPIKFPLLLNQGVEGIAVGLSTKILPHNFNELLESKIKSPSFKKQQGGPTRWFIGKSRTVEATFESPVRLSLIHI